MNFRSSPGGVFFGEVIYPPGGTFGPHTQRTYNLVVIHRGVANILRDDEKIVVGPGQAILLTPGHHVHYSFSTNNDTYHSWCMVRPTSVPREMRRLFDSVQNAGPFDSHLSDLLKLGKETLSRNASNKILGDAFCFSLGLSVLFGFAIAQIGPVVGSPGDEALARLDDYISREYAKPLQLEHLAAAAGVSRQHLLRLFRKRNWSTPTARLYEKRLQSAADLLAHTGLSIGEISQRCGFASAFHFSKKFHQTYGQSPRAWRAQVSNGTF